MLQNVGPWVDHIEAEATRDVLRGEARGPINWRYAVGEVVLIVVGILIALAASQWQAGRAERRTELALLSELHTGLSADLSAARGLLDRHRRIAGQHTQLLDHMRQGEPYADSLAGPFGAAYGFGTIDFNRAAYESIKSQGLDLVSDPSLRSAVAHLYEQSIPLAEASVAVEQNVILDLLRPYYLAHFRNLRFNASAEPLDYAALLADTEFHNLLDYRLQVLLQNHIPGLEKLIPEIERVLLEIEAELDG